MPRLSTTCFLFLAVFASSAFGQAHPKGHKAIVKAHEEGAEGGARGNTGTAATSFDVEPGTLTSASDSQISSKPTATAATKDDYASDMQKLVEASTLEYKLSLPGRGSGVILGSNPFVDAQAGDMQQLVVASALEYELAWVEPGESNSLLEELAKDATDLGADLAEVMVEGAVEAATDAATGYIENYGVGSPHRDSAATAILNSHLSVNHHETRPSPSKHTQMAQLETSRTAKPVTKPTNVAASPSPLLSRPEPVTYPGGGCNKTGGQLEHCSRYFTVVQLPGGPLLLSMRREGRAHIFVSEEHQGPQSNHSRSGQRSNRGLIFLKESESFVNGSKLLLRGGVVAEGFDNLAHNFGITLDGEGEQQSLLFYGGLDSPFKHHHKDYLPGIYTMHIPLSTLHTPQPTNAGHLLSRLDFARDWSKPLFLMKGTNGIQDCRDDRPSMKFSHCEFDGRLSIVKFKSKYLMYARANLYSHGHRYVQVSSSSDKKSWSKFCGVRMQGFDPNANKSNIYFFLAQINPANEDQLLAVFPVVDKRGEAMVAAAASTDGYKWSSAIPLLYSRAVGERSADHPASVFIKDSSGNTSLYMHLNVPGIGYKVKEEGAPGAASEQGQLLRYSVDHQAFQERVEQALREMREGGTPPAGSFLEEWFTTTPENVNQWLCKEGEEGGRGGSKAS